MQPAASLSIGRAALHPGDQRIQACGQKPAAHADGGTTGARGSLLSQSLLICPSHQVF